MMKTRTTSNSRRRCGGYFSLPMVGALGLAMMTTMLYAYTRNIRSQDMQARSQLRIDYAQKEDAMLRALINIVPNKAIGAMQRGSADNASDYTWETIFEEPIELAGAETAIDQATMSALGDGLINANTGDTNYSDASELVQAVTGGSKFVNVGLSRDPVNEHVLFDQMPAMLWSNSSHYELSQDYPIVTSRVTHDSNYRKGIHLDPNTYPEYNQLTYPNIDFGYARPGDKFVGKRNWWAFSMRFGDKDAAKTGAPILLKNYLISLYEVPSQMPLSSGAVMTVGKHADGSDWGNVTLDGGLFAGTLETEGTFDLTGGLISARRGLNLSDSTSVDGVSVDSDVYAMGTREQALAASQNNLLRASIGGNVGRSAFIPLSRGEDFFNLQGDSGSNQRISPTGWNFYSTGGIQCDMRIRVLEVAAADDQTPISVQFYYRRPNNSRTTITYTRGDNWPAEGETGGDEFPFQTELLTIGRRALIYHPERMPAFLDSIGAGDVTVNESIYIYPDQRRTNVTAPSFPSAAGDLAVVLRSCEDLSDYTAGFSLVTNCRLYIGESLNLVTIPVAPEFESGLDPTVPFFPPVSLFAPEKRYGTADITQGVLFHGQLASVKEDPTEAYRPLDMKSGTGQTVLPQNIEADLKRLTSPAELAPVKLMNWLITVEEIHPPQP